MLGPRAIAWWAMRTQTAETHVEGLAHVPRDGPVLIVARHFHNLLDGAMLITHVPRPVHVLVGLDWAHGATLAVMERVCALAQWPVIMRGRAFARSGLRDAAALLADGRVVAVFPEGAPAVDPHGVPPARDADGFLPFAQGWRVIAMLAKRAAIVPAGFAYEPHTGGRWNVTLRFGPPLAADIDAAALEAEVRRLSR